MLVTLNAAKREATLPVLAVKGAIRDIFPEISEPPKEATLTLSAITEAKRKRPPRPNE